MAAKKEKWKHTDDRFVAFLDIMGFKDRLLREGQEKVGIMLKSLRPPIADIKKRRQVFYAEVKKASNKNTLQDDLSSLVYPVTFSDSIILFSKDKSDYSAVEIIASTATILSKALNKEIPIKGAIAFGEMTVYKTSLLYFGTPLIDAYELQKELQIYGVVLHHTAQRQIDKFSRARALSNLFAPNYSVPMKSGSIEHNLVNWVFKTKNPENVVRKLYSNTSGKSRKYIDNTLKFIIDYKTAIKQAQDEALQKGIIKKTTQ